MLVDDTPRHHKVRNVWAKPTSMSGIAAMAGDIEMIVDTLVVPVAERLHAGDTINLVGVFEDLTSELITVLMDIPRARKYDFLKWNRVISDAAVIPLDDNNPIFPLRNEYKASVFDFLRTQVQDRRERLARGEEPQDLISLMVAANSEGITESVVLDNLLNLLLGALDTSVRWMGNIFMVLDRHPQILAEIRADRSLIPQAIEEVMRVESVVQRNLRITRNENTEIGGQKLKAGDLVYMLTGAANRDPAAFDRPGEFDIRRKPKIHLGFGFGMHQCLGMNIARKEVVILLNRLFDLVPAFEIVASDYGPTWVLWGPLRLMVRATADNTSQPIGRHTSRVAAPVQCQPVCPSPALANAPPVGKGGKTHSSDRSHQAWLYTCCAWLDRWRDYPGHSRQIRSTPRTSVDAETSIRPPRRSNLST